MASLRTAPEPRTTNPTLAIPVNDNSVMLDRDERWSLKV